MALVCVLMGAAAVLAGGTIPISIKVSPHVIVMRSPTAQLTVHTNIPYGTVDRNSVELGIEPNGGSLNPLRTFADDRGNLVAKFDLDVVKTMVSADYATFTLGGYTTSEARFEGSETVQVKDH
jgi:hypothetical protein